MMNPGKDPTNVGVTFMTAGGTQKYEVYAVGAQKRVTINVADVIGRGQDVALALVSDKPIAAERSMYFDYRDKWNGATRYQAPPTRRNPGTSLKAPPGTTPPTAPSTSGSASANPGDRGRGRHHHLQRGGHPGGPQGERASLRQDNQGRGR